MRVSALWIVVFISASASNTTDFCDGQYSDAVKTSSLLQKRFVAQSKLYAWEGEELNAHEENATLHWTSWPKKVEMSHCRATDLLACRQALARASQIDISLRRNATAVTNNAPNSVAKIAFLFLVKEVLEQEALWDSFFEDAQPWRYSVYVHRASSHGSAEPLSKWGAVSVPRVPSHWCALVGAEVAVVTEALRDQANMQYVLVSDSTVPLKSFDYIYSELVHKSVNTSKICWVHDTLHNDLEFHPKHHQWVVLSRQNAQTFVSKSEAAIRFIYDAFPRFGRWGCSDELIFTAALFPDFESRLANKTAFRHHVSRNGVEQACLTWVMWPKGPNPSGSPQHCGNNASIQLSQLKALVIDEGLMFGRKFNRGCFISMGSHQALLHAVLPLLWKDAIKF